MDWSDFNITVYEAISACTKVVASDEGDIDCDLIKGDYVVQAEPNEESISKAILKATKMIPKIRNDELYTILDNYTWLTYCKNIVKLINI